MDVQSENEVTAEPETPREAAPLFIEQYLVLQWNGLRWCANNTHHALVPCGPYSSRESAQANIDKFVAENEDDFPHAERHVCIVPVMWPMDPPTGFKCVPQFGD